MEYLQRVKNKRAREKAQRTASSSPVPQIPPPQQQQQPIQSQHPLPLQQQSVQPKRHHQPQQQLPPIPPPESSRQLQQQSQQQHREPQPSGQLQQQPQQRREPQLSRQSQQEPQQQHRELQPSRQSQHHPPLQQQSPLPQQQQRPPSKTQFAAICNPKTYVIKEKEYILGPEIGRGGSSRVYEARHKNKIYAIKVVDLENLDKKVFDGYMEEVKLLKDLQGTDGIIQLEDYELKNDENGKELLVVMEKGENDFQTFLRSSDRSPNLIRYYWESMLNCVKVVHSKSIVHSDLKPANFIFVKNKLKLIDFGIASSIPTDVTSVAKEWQAGTLNYMSPESIQLRSDDNKVHVPLASDIWSLGCILYLMVYGSPPFANMSSQMAKINAILNKDIEFKPIDDENLSNVMQICLQRDYQKRPTITQLLEHSYLRPNTSSTTNNTSASNLMSSTYKSAEEDSEMVERIVEEVRNNTPKTAAKMVAKMLKAHSTSGISFRDNDS